jgi:hypothetical protein
MTSKKRAVEIGSGFFKKAKSGRQDLNHVGGRPSGNSAGIRSAETTLFCRAPNLITICEAIPAPSISKVAQDSTNPDRLS